LTNAAGKSVASGCLDPGYPRPTGIRQAMLSWPTKEDWSGLKLRAELEVKGVTHPLRWACRQQLDADGSLTLHRNVRG
jgi:hypothetical protein